MSSTDPFTARQYTTGLIRESIEHALRAAGKDPEALVPEDLGMLEDFHSLGRLGTIGLIEAAGITAGDRVLDAGTVTAAAGFDVAVWTDLTDFAIPVMTPILTAPPAPLSLGAFVPDFPAKGQNLLANATQDRVRLIQAVQIAR